MLKLYHKRKRLKNDVHKIISQKSINEIFNKINIYDIIKDFVCLRKSGNDYVGRCPICKTLTKNNRYFRVSENKKIYKCFECGIGGTNAVSFLMRYSNISFSDALFFINKHYSKINIIVEKTVFRDKNCIDEDLPF